MNANLNLNTFAMSGAGTDPQAKARKIAADRFQKALSEGRSSRFWGRLSGRNSRLQTLEHTPSRTGRRSVGITHVALDRIVGSEGRSEDFDADFRPLKTHNQDRWIGIAAARRMGVALPAVELVQDGDRYYVRDGHHRISVAKAMGQLEIEARIVN